MKWLVERSFQIGVFRSLGFGAYKGRYKSQALLDEAALLTCMAYVDLNPIRAKMAKTPETSDYTSVKDRIAKAIGGSVRKQHSHLKPLRSRGQNPETAIPFDLSSYLELVDWTGRIVRQDNKGHIPENLPPILDRLKIDPNEWLKTMSWNNPEWAGWGRKPRVQWLQSCSVRIAMLEHSHLCIPEHSATYSINIRPPIPGLSGH